MWSNRLKRIFTAVWKYRSAYDIILEQNRLDIKNAIQESGLDLEFPLGKMWETVRLAYKGNGNYAITEKEKKEARALGLIREKESIISQTLRYARILVENGVDLTNI